MNIPDELLEIHARLINWGHWAHGGRLPDTRCQSIESRYRSPQTWYPAVPRVSVGERDAYAVECAVRKLPEIPRFLIRGYYVHRRNPSALMRKLRIRSGADLEQKLIAALFLLRGVDNRCAFGKLPLNNLFAPHGLIEMPAA